MLLDQLVPRLSPLEHVIKELRSQKKPLFFSALFFRPRNMFFTHFYLEYRYYFGRGGGQGVEVRFSTAPMSDLPSSIPFLALLAFGSQFVQAPHPRAWDVCRK